MRRLLLALCLAAVPFAANAAADVGPSEKIPVGGTMRGNFAEEHYSTKAGQPPLHSEGHFIVAPGHGIIWMVEKPLPLTFVITPDGMTQAIGNVPLMQTPSSKMPLLARATDLIGNALNGAWQPLQKDFAVDRKSTATGWQATLTPLDPKGGMPFKSLVTTGGKYVETATVTRPDGGQEKIAFSNQTASPSPPTDVEMAAFARRGGLNYAIGGTK